MADQCQYVASDPLLAPELVRACVRPCTLLTHWHSQGTLLPPTSAGSPLRFSRAPWLLGFDGTGLRTPGRDPLKKNVPPSHFTKWPRGTLVSSTESLARTGCPLGV